MPRSEIAFYCVLGGDQGTIPRAPRRRISFKYLVQKIARDGKVPLTIVRRGKEFKVQAPVPSSWPTVILNLEGEYPPYFIYGPIVFSSATADFVDGFSRGSMGGALMGGLGSLASPLLRRLGDKPAFEGEGLAVVSSPFFPHKLSLGYQNPTAKVVKSVNGHPVRNLGHLVALLRDSKDQFIVIEFDSRAAETLVLSRAEILATTEEILADNGIRSQGSPELLDIWTGKTPHSRAP